MAGRTGLASNAIRAQQKRDERLRRERRAAIFAQETKTVGRQERGKTRRTRLGGEYNLAQQRTANIGQMNVTERQQEGETKRARLADVGNTSRTGMTVAGGIKQESMKLRGEQQVLGRTIKANKEAATVAAGRETSKYHRELAGDVFKGGGSPSTASQLAASGSHSTNYEGLKPVKQVREKKYTHISAERDSSRSSNVLSPAGSFEETEGKFKAYDPKEAAALNLQSLRDLKLKEDEEERLRRKNLGL